MFWNLFLETFGTIVLVMVLGYLIYWLAHRNDDKSKNPESE